MTKQHTPGKWFIDTNLHIYSEGVPVPNDCGGTTSKSIHLATAKNAADAMLMATAPELLAALQGFQKAWDENRLVTSEESQVIRSAIAKATGK